MEKDVISGRYGDYLNPLDKNALLVIIEERDDPDVIRFIEIADRTRRAEIISDPGTWTDAENDAWKREDWRAFSTLRGYTDREIEDFSEYLQLAHKLDLKYGEDYSISINYLVQEQIGAVGW